LASKERVKPPGGKPAFSARKAPESSFFFLLAKGKIIKWMSG